jgi:acyl-CoA synthetase (AMP-forming)/AMP-acid ligase II
MILDMAVQQTGAVLTPIYPTINVNELEFILNDAAVKLVFVSDEEAAALERCADVGMAEARYVDGRKVQSIGGTPRPPPIEMLPEAMCAALLIPCIPARHPCVLTADLCSRVTRQPRLGTELVRRARGRWHLSSGRASKSHHRE